MADVEEVKRRVAARAIEEVEDGMVLGLGSGSTAAHAIRAVSDAGLDVVGVPTSRQSACVAREVGIPVRCLQDVSAVDLAIDGADQVAGFDLVKGGGGAHTREKVVDAAADRFVVVVDESKVVDMLDLPVPIEVLPDARPFVEASVRSLGGEPRLRVSGVQNPTITDNGNVIVDCNFGRMSDPSAIADALNAMPGIVDHGLFLDLVDTIYVGTTNEVRVTHRST